MSDKNQVYINFVNGAHVEIKGDYQNAYQIDFIDKTTNEIKHQSSILNNMWTKAFFLNFIDWKIKIYENGEFFYEYDFNAKNKNVFIKIESKILEDTLEWIPYVDEFRKKHECKLICSSFHNDFLKEEYSNIEFVTPDTSVNDLYAMYRLGVSEGGVDVKYQTMQRVISDSLGLEYKQLKSNIKRINKNIKIALCVSGKFRNSVFCFPTIYRNFLTNRNTDVFIHSWDYVQQPFDLYNPKEIIIESESEILQKELKNIKLLDDVKINKDSNMNNNILMYYGIYKLINTISDDYDYIIRIRPDLYINGKINLSKIINDLKSGVYDIQIPNQRYNYSGINDQIAIGSYNTMKKYSEVFKNINNIVNESKYWHPETILKHHLSNLGLKINQLDLEYGIVRNVIPQFTKNCQINYKSV